MRLVLGGGGVPSLELSDIIAYPIHVCTHVRDCSVSVPFSYLCFSPRVLSLLCCLFIVLLSLSSFFFFLFSNNTGTTTTIGMDSTRCKRFVAPNYPETAYCSKCCCFVSLGCRTPKAKSRVLTLIELYPPQVFSYVVDKVLDG